MSLADKYISRDGVRPAPVPVTIDVSATFRAADPGAPAGARRRWAEHERLAFNTMKPHALYVAGPEMPVSGAVHDPETGEVTEQFGGAHGLRLVAIGTNAAPPWADKISATWNKAPFWRARLLVRLWVPSDAHAARFEEVARDYFQAAAVVPGLNAGFIGLRHDVPLDDPVSGVGVKQHLKRIAREAGMQFCLDDAELWADCARMAERAMALKGR